MRRETTVAYVLLTLTALAWASTVIVGRAASDAVPPLGFNFWRWVVALVCVAPFGIRGAIGHWDDIRRHLPLLVLLGVLNMAGFGSFLFLGLERTQGVNGSLLLGTMPINIVLVAWLITRARISASQVAGIVAGLGGVAVIVARGDPAVLAGLSFNLGDPLIFLSMVFYAVYSVLLPRAPKGLPLTTLMMVLCAVGVVACAPFYLWETLGAGRPVRLGIEFAWSIAWIGIVSSLLAQIFWVSGINRVGAATAGYFIYLAPVFGTVMAIVLLGETFRWFHAAGILLVFAGIFLATRNARGVEK